MARRRRRTRLLAGALVVLGLSVPAALPSSAAASSATPVLSAYGDAAVLGAPASDRLGAPLVGIVPSADGRGYWLLSARGGVFTYGDASFYGTPGDASRWGPFVGMAASADGGGYWIARDDGVVYNFGDAAELEPDTFPAAPIVGMAAAPGTAGFWLVGTDGGVFSLGGARFYGSLGHERLAAAIVGMASTPDGRGYWLVGADGGVFSFGDAPFFGSMGGRHLNGAVVGMAPTPDGRGYWLVGADGGVFSFGDAVYRGSAGSTPAQPLTPVVGMAGTHDGAGYWLVATGRPLARGGPVPRVVAQCESDSGDPAVEPTQIVLACGDGNAYLDHLVWSSWSSAGAVGRGEFVHNTCTPDCAEGTFVSSPATVRLAYPIATGAGEEFAGLSFTTVGPSAPSGRYSESEVIPTSHG